MGPDGAQRSCLPTFYLFQLTTGVLSRTLLLPDPKPGMLHSHFRGFYQMAGFPEIVYAWCLEIHTNRGKGRASQLRKHAMPHGPFVYQGRCNAAVSWRHRLYRVVEASFQQETSCVKSNKKKWAAKKYWLEYGLESKYLHQSCERAYPTRSKTNQSCPIVPSTTRTYLSEKLRLSSKYPPLTLPPRFVPRSRNRASSSYVSDTTTTSSRICYPSSETCLTFSIRG